MIRFCLTSVFLRVFTESVSIGPQFIPFECLSPNMGRWIRESEIPFQLFDISSLMFASPFSI